jgi:hypothetical protein
MSSAPATAARISPLDAAQQALGHTRRQLFPFRFDRWLALGFVAFLDQCGRTQAGMSLRVPGGLPDRGGGGGRGAEPVLTEIGAWIAAHVMIVMAVAAVLLVVVLCLTALVLWINSRGVFMYVDDVATGRADVSRPWREHAARADSYFAWSFGLALAVLTGGIVLVVTGALVGFRMVRGGHSALPVGIAALVVLVGLLLVLVLASALASLALRDFVAPLQMRTGWSCGTAIGLFLTLLRAHPGAFAVYVILKVVFAMVLAFVVLVAACLTCCCALIPVVTQTLLQPAFYFERAWSLCLLRQLGYDLLPPPSGVTFGTKEELPHAPEPR